MEEEFCQHATRHALSITPLQRGDWRLCRAFNLEAVQLEPWAFVTHYRTYLNTTEREWRQTCHTPGKEQTFVLNMCDKPIGITTVTADHRAPVAHLNSSYLREHRGEGLSHYLYRARLQQALEWDLQVADLLCRDSNTPSRNAAARWGFCPVQTTPRMAFGDGTEGDLLHYAVNLADIAPALTVMDQVDPIAILTHR